MLPCHGQSGRALPRRRVALPGFTDDRVVLSRVISGPPLVPSPIRTGNRPKTIVVIANPRGLLPLHMKEENARVRIAMKGFPASVQRPATLEGLLSKLDAGVDLCYLVCRASRHEQRSYLWLEDENGLLCHVPDTELVKRIRELDHKPRLLILVSYQDRASGGEHPLAALGPSLVEAGIPSVLLLLSPISARTMNSFLVVFFRELKKHGTIDRAVAEARGAVSDAPDYWLPALFQEAGDGDAGIAEPEGHIGRGIGPYRLERKLGQGGMGVVYLGRRQDEELEMAVAVKLAHERLASPELLERFRRERQLLADLKHSHIAMLLDAGTTPDGRPYFIMEYIEGATIDAWCAEHQPSLARLLRLFREVLAAVGFAHGKGVIHRDLKPGNLMVTSEGEPKLLDFGIARLTREEEATITGPEQVLMTPAYASPEQLVGRAVTPASDIYALGLILLELLTRRRPGHWGCPALQAVTRLIAEGRPWLDGETRPDNTSKPGSASDGVTPAHPALGSSGLSTDTEYLEPAAMETVDFTEVIPEIKRDGVSNTAMTVPQDAIQANHAGGLKRKMTGQPGDSPSEDSDTSRIAKPGSRETMPEALGHVLRTALADNPAFRYGDTAAFMGDIDRVLAGLPGPHESGSSLEKTYDALMWYHPDDRQEIEIFSGHLKDRGMNIWFDVWSHRPGRDPVHELGVALDASRVCLVFLGARQRMPWAADTVIRDRLAFRSEDLVTLPVLLPGAAFPDKQSGLPSFLRDRVWLTFPNGLAQKELDRLALTIEDIRRQGDEELVPTGVCPFRGLEVFREEDREFFFGREATSQRILQHLKQQPFVGVLGPSGSGKSSVVRAGVMPHLPEAGFTVALMTPTALPLEELAFSLSSLFYKAGRSQPAEYLLNRLRGSREALYFIVRELFEDQAEGRLCLVFDQFEEIFTLAADSASRDRFVSLLCYALEQPRGKLSLLLTMRSDFLGKSVAFPDLNSYILDHSLQVLPMNREDLARAIVAPARLAGLRLETGLLDRILDDVTGSAGELPLLEHALLELYERRNGGLLTWQAYEEIGGIEGALARRAESEYETLSREGRETLRKMFTLCLVHPGEGVEDTRRRATREELLSVGPSTVVVEGLLDRWMRARLLTGSSDEARNQQLVDVAHEALIRKWDRIRTWMAEDRETARLLGRLRREARTWQSSGRNPDHLLRGGPLYQMKDLVERESSNMGELEKTFVAAGIRQTRRRKNLAVLVGCLGFVLAAVAFVMFYKARSARQSALFEKSKAEQRTREGNYNLAMMFNEKAGVALAEGRPQEAWLYALAAMSREIPARETLPGAVGRFADPGLEGAGRLLWTSPVATPANHVAYNRAGTLLAMAGNDHVIRLIDTASGGPAGVLTGHTNLIQAMVFSPNGNQLASGSADRDIRLWSISGENWELAGAERVLRGHPSAVTDVAFSAEGELLASASSDGTIHLWDSVSGTLLKSWRGHGARINCLGFSTDGKMLAFGGASGRIGLIILASGKERLLGGRSPVRDLCFIEDSLAIGLDDGRIRILDPADGSEERVLSGHRGAVVALVALSGGDRLASLGVDGRVSIQSISGKFPRLEWLAFEGRDLVEEELLDGEDQEDEHMEATAPNGEDEEDDSDEENNVDEPGSDGSETGMSLQGSLSVTEDGKFLVCVLEGRFPRVWTLAGSQPEVISTPSGHSSDVLGVAYSPDGRVLATTSADGIPRLWSIPDILDGERSGREVLAALPDHEDEVNGVAFSPDGRLLVTISGDETVRLWSVPDVLDGGAGERAEAAVLVGHEDEVLGLAFSPDGGLLATSSGDQTIRLWRIARNEGSGLPAVEELALLEGHGAEVFSVAFSPDGGLLASSSGDQTIRLWSMAEILAQSPAGGKPLAILSDHASHVVSVAFSPDGKTLASGSDDRTVRLWSIPKVLRGGSGGGRPLAILSGHVSDVAAVAFSPDGTLLASGSDDRTVRLWSMAGFSGKDRLPPRTLTTLSGHSAAIVCLAFSPDGRTLATAAEDSTARLWQLPAHSEWGAAGALSSATLTGHSAAVVEVVSSPGGKVLASASEDQTIRLWSLPKLARGGVTAPGSTIVLAGHKSDVSSVAFSPVGRILASSSDDRTVKLWSVPGIEVGDLAGIEELASLSGHTSDVVSLSFSPDGRLLASSSDDRTIRLWSIPGIDSGAVFRVEALAVLRGHSSDVVDLAFSPDGRLLASASDDRGLRLWSIPDQFDKEEDGHQALATLLGHSSDVTGVAFSPDGELLASASEDQTVKLWSVAAVLAGGGTERGELATLSGHSKWVLAVAWSRDGKILASACGDGSVHLWSISREADGRSIRTRPLAVLAGHEGEVHGLAFSPENGLLASASGDTDLRLWRPGDLRFFMEARTERSTFERLFRRSLFHFGYRLDGFQLVPEARFSLEPLGSYRFPGKHVFADLAHGRPHDQKLIDWLAGANPSR